MLSEGRPQRMIQAVSQLLYHELNLRLGHASSAESISSVRPMLHCMHTGEEKGRAGREEHVTTTYSTGTH